MIVLLSEETESAGLGRNVEYKDFRSIDPGADQPFNEGDARKRTSFSGLLLVSVICCGPTSYSQR